MDSKYRYRVITEGEARSTILRNKKIFVPWIGAGVSIESQVPGADDICAEMKKKRLIEIQGERQFNNVHPLEVSGQEEQAILEKEFGWQDRSLRYARAIKCCFPGFHERVDYFRTLVSGRSPCFGHYATALLMSNKIFARESITTNFDKLLERAFYEMGSVECQPLRNVDELQFYQLYPDKSYCIKIHGDYDTHNLLNTEHETVAIERAMAGYVEGILRNKGAIIIGSGGFEKSIHTLFDQLTSSEVAKTGVLKYGLLWGVYVESAGADIQEVLEERIKSGDYVSAEIMKMMHRRFDSGNIFAFFPLIGGAGAFLQRLILQTRDKRLIGLAEPYYDHEMRIISIFQKQGLSEKAAKDHINRLRAARIRLEQASSPTHAVCALQKQMFQSPFTLTLSLCYGSLSDRRLLDEEKSDCGRAAILSPDDTFISIGGGTALAIAKEAGYRNIVHDVSKLSPIALGEVAVTSGGSLPVQYVLHGASVEIREHDIHWSQESISNTVSAALSKCIPLGIEVLFIPLLAAGTGRAPPALSLSRILSAISDFSRGCANHGNGFKNFKIVIVVYQESELPRHVFEQQLEQVFASWQASFDRALRLRLPCANSWRRDRSNNRTSLLHCMSPEVADFVAKVVDGLAEQ